MRAARIVAFLACASSLGVPAHAEDNRFSGIFGPNSSKADTKGDPVLCMWRFYLTIQQMGAACKVDRKPIDDVLDESIAAIDDFIVANSSSHPTREMLEDFKRSSAAPSAPPSRVLFMCRAAGSA